MDSTPAALVLGASGTLGGAIARKLHEKGYALGLHAFQHPERIPAFNPQSAPRNAQTFNADFREGMQIEKLAKDYFAAFGRVDALVWAAGIAKDAPLASQPEADLREVLAVNLTAPFLFAKAFARSFLKQRSGAVVLVSSHAGLSGRAGGAAYAMAQSGLLALAKSLAREWGASAVRVNAVVPPFVPNSAMGRAASAEFAEAVKGRSVLRPAAEGGLGPAQGVANFVANLLEHSTASGQVFVLDSRIAN